MSDDCKNIDSILFKRNGTNQQERFYSILEPENLKLNDFDTEDWILFAYNFAKHLNYFDVSNSQSPSGNWQELFNHFELANGTIPQRTDKGYAVLKSKITTLISEVEIDNSLTPHMTLFVCFLKLLELSKNRFNLITKKHLDFFYQDILQIQKLPATADKVHILFELAKKSIEEKIEVGTEFDAGKDVLGKKRIYKTSEELIANKTTISHLKSVYNDIKLGEIKYSDVANSLDGKGETLKNDSKFWFPFGYTSTEKNYTELADAKLGFAIAAEILNLQEGERNISITITFDKNFDFPAQPFTTDDLVQNLAIYCSGAKEWLGKFELSKNPIFKNSTETSNISGNQLRLVFQIPKEIEAISAYNQQILGENFNTTLPVIRFLINTRSRKGHSLFRHLVTKKITAINVKVDVRDVKSLQLENDNGLLNPLKPFYPFTTQPEKKSSFTINYPEIFAKKWSNLTVNLTWKNTPNDFVKHYDVYKIAHLDTVSQKSFFDSIFKEITEDETLKANQPEDKSKEDAATAKKLAGITKRVLNPDNPIVTNNGHFQATVSVLNKEVWDKRNSNVILFNDPDNDKIFETAITLTDGAKYEIGKSGPIKLSLNQSFYHSIYPKIYTLAIFNLAKDQETPIPNEPYTPLAESISLDYTAEENMMLSAKAYDINRIKVFQEGPFGQKEEHPYLRQNAIDDEILEKNAPTTIELVPDYCHGGEFYIGLDDAKNLQQITLLFQILEGSENPLASSFTGKQKVEWSILCNNNWKNIENNILGNEIDNFLKSGILKFSIPKQASNDNTLFPPNTFWIKAKIHKAYNAVCKLIDVKTQVVTATFFDDGNDLSHLISGLAAETISKLVNRVSQVKSVSQPFNSFDGKPIEDNSNYYRRVSERLRHKNRAISLWDYEHLILQEFPEVFRVKCLNHTSNSGNSYLSPGDVTIVVIPDIVNKNVFDIYEPRVSTATLNKIKNYINNRNTMHVEAAVINPAYEKVIVKLNVKFYDQFDENFYKKQLNEDITKFLSPWAFDSTKEIIFGIELERSIIIDYIEKLNYVDFLDNLEIAKYPDALDDDENNKNNESSLTFSKVILPSSPKHILVSVKNHLVSTTITTCSTPNYEKPETCQY